jgi:hypothetical protein
MVILGYRRRPEDYDAPNNRLYCRTVAATQEMTPGKSWHTA